MLPLTALLNKKAQQNLVRLQEKVGVDFSTDENDLAVLALSDFVVDNLLSHPQWWQELHQPPPHSDEWKNYSAWLHSQLESVCDENQLMQLLRIFRRRIMLRIAWLQTLQTCTTEQTLKQLSVLAEVLIIAARDWLYDICCQELGTPCNHSGKPQPLLILAMGKLGGGELNFSSDIDLIFSYPENGLTQNGRKQVDNAQFFTRLGQRLIKVLSQQTVDGFVYRVDMRLRPFGESGPLVLSFAALEDYYQEQGRDWERYAMIKVCLIDNKNSPYHDELQHMLRPFVYRRYIDFSVVQSLRNMKEMIEREVNRRGLHNNIKLGAGGIREIEFITQVFQLIRGGREPALQNRALLTTLDTIAKLELLPVDNVELLKESYLFLRRLENVLQAIADQQTQILPDDELDQERLAWAMSFPSWQKLRHHFKQNCVAVRLIFDELIGYEQESEQSTPINQSFAPLWFDGLSSDELMILVSHFSLEQANKVLSELAAFRHDLHKRTIGTRGRDVLDQLMPCLLAEVCQYDNAHVVLPRLTYLILNIVSRTTYLELLLKHQAALKQLVKLCAASPMIATQLARYPILLDELLNLQSLYKPIALESYQDELHQYLLRIAHDDQEQQVEALRQFKQTQLLHIAAADISGTLPTMKVSDHLTYLAEAIIEQVIQKAWTQMTTRYGRPVYLMGKQGIGFAVIGYGKLGGWELGYGSDLDLVFISDCPANIMTDGVKSIDGRQFYLRLAQRVMHLFNVRTTSGILYDVDIRLRPAGEAGLLVSSVEAFADYQYNEAWLWEHQALVRGRIVYGDQEIKQQFDEIRHQVLCYSRDEQTLQQAVKDMRIKMLAHLGNKNPELFDIKADQWGITDIEFISQYLVLRYAHQQEKLTRWSDNVRIFELMAHYQIMSEQEAATLTQIYINMRSKTHQLALQDLPSIVPVNYFAHERELVKQSWLHWLGDTVVKDMLPQQ